MNAKAMAKTLESSLAARNIDLPHSAALEIVAAQFGCKDWNVLSARIASETRTDDGSIAIQPAIPVVRTFSEEKAREFDCDWPGFRVDWEHRFAPGMPLYQQISCSKRCCISASITAMRRRDRRASSGWSVSRSITANCMPSATRHASRHREGGLGSGNDGDRPVRQPHPVLRAAARLTFAHDETRFETPRRRKHRGVLTTVRN